MVGGVAPGTPEVDRSQRRPPRGVTPARLFTMSVGTMKPSRRDDLQSYHGRVASALSIDRIRRVLEFTCIKSETPDSPIRAMPLLADLEHGSWAQGVDDDDLRGNPGMKPMTRCPKYEKQQFINYWHSRRWQCSTEAISPYSPLQVFQPPAFNFHSLHPANEYLKEFSMLQICVMISTALF
jgi:hypothetical protein